MIKVGVLKLLKIKNLINFNNISPNNKNSIYKINTVFIINT
jgi:hypothetical protein